MPRTKQFDETEVLEKALEVFWRQGFNGTSMQDLVDAMGINRASLYDTFGNKEELFDRVFREYRESSKQRIRDFLYAQHSVREGILALFEQTIDQAIRDPQAKGCFVVNTTTELAAGNQDLCATLSQNRADLELLFLDYLHLGVEYGQLHPGKDLQTIASLLFTLYNGIMVLVKVNPDKERLMATVRAGLEVLN